MCEVFKNKSFIEHFRWLLLEVVTKDINKLKHFKEESQYSRKTSENLYPVQ